MKTEKEIISIITKNLVEYRKINNLTQLELANKLNYSDKAVSKWERGESLPDIYILYTLADLYGISLNDLISENEIKPKPKKMFQKRLITLLSVGLAWLIATLIFILLVTLKINRPWLAYIAAVPVSSIIFTVFASLWENRFIRFIAVSLIVWTIPFFIHITLMTVFSLSWLFYIIAVPMEILTVLWYIFIKVKK